MTRLATRSFASDVLRFVANRLIKAFANTMKGAYYLVHLVLPNKRFVIPRYAPPLLKRNGLRAIPRTIWQTNFIDRVTFPIFLNYLFNRMLAPTHEYRFATDDDCANFVRTKYPGAIWEAYQNLRIGASRADLWRILVLHEHGGTYLDVDAHLMWPLELLINSDDRDLFVSDRLGRLTNFFMASAPRNPLLAKAAKRIAENIHTAASSDVFDLTGPGALMSALADERFRIEPYKFVCDQGNFTNSFFQYVDHPTGKWTEEQKVGGVFVRSKRKY
jgi:mannosyltransferase OCH1-like enzyme